MPTKIRLQRKGKTGRAFYHIVIADGRAPRDGRFIEKIGTYNPLTKPADIDIDFDRALYWLQVGAQPTDTCKAILSYKGVLYKNHLQIGVKKGALTQEQADARFDAWLKEKMEKISGSVKDYEQSSKSETKKRLDAERKVNEERAKKLAAKRAAELKAQTAAESETEAEAVSNPEEQPTAEAEIAQTPEENIQVTEPAANAENSEEVKADLPAEETGESMENKDSEKTE